MTKNGNPMHAKEGPPQKSSGPRRLMWCEGPIGARSSGDSMAVEVQYMQAAFDARPSRPFAIRAAQRGNDPSAAAWVTTRAAGCKTGSCSVACS